MLERPIHRCRQHFTLRNGNLMRLGGALTLQFETMRWCAPRWIALFLALLIAVTPAVLAAPSAAAALPMSASGCAVSDDDCQCCHENQAERTACPPICVHTLLFAATAHQSDSGFVAFEGDDWLSGDLLLRGFVLSPDPPPPKSAVLR
jgi:hypothetical protein